MAATGKSIIITGGGSGIGRATARLFLDKGWHVGLIGRRKEPLMETADGHSGALVLPCDVSDPDQVDVAFDEAMADWGCIDALFNNAGTNVKPAPIDEIPVEDWLKVCSINLTGMVLCARAAFGRMRRQDPQGGRIINNGSISAYAPRPGSVPYTTTKHAISGLTKTLSLDGRPFDIACGQIDIGNALTDMAQAMTQGVPQADGSVKVEAVMDVAQVAETVFYMASLPLEANIQSVTVMATKMPFVGRG